MLIRLTQRQGLGIFLLLTGILLFAGQYWYFNLRPQDTLLPLAQSHLSGMQDNIQGFLLANPDFKKHLIDVGRAEVFSVLPANTQVPSEFSDICLLQTCWLVQVYLFDQDTTLSSLVQENPLKVLAVIPQPHTRPALGAQQMQAALRIALDAPAVAQELGYIPTRADMNPVVGGVQNAICAEHLCAAATFAEGNRNLWAVIDLNTETLVNVHWNEPSAADAIVTVTPVPPDVMTAVAQRICPEPGKVELAGWQLRYEVSPSNGLRVADVTFRGRSVLRSASIVEWDADYGGSGFDDTTGCVGVIGPDYVPPFGQTKVHLLPAANGFPEGFEVVQDFRMINWGDYCNYRYMQHYQFYVDGSFRPKVVSFGKGCGNLVTYRPKMRLDIAMDGDGQHIFEQWQAGNWQTSLIEIWAQQDIRQLSPQWRIYNQATGHGYTIEASRGQFAAGDQAENAYIYATLHKPSEGDTNLGIFGATFVKTHEQGPHWFIDGEAIYGQDITLWYVPQLVANGQPGEYYCWTVRGEPDPETYPCSGGPLFTPFSLATPTP